MMSIRAEKEALDLERDEMSIRHESEKTMLAAKYKMLRIRCRTHPNGYATYCMGDRGFYCPDCGYAT